MRKITDKETPHNDRNTISEIESKVKAEEAVHPFRTWEVHRAGRRSGRCHRVTLDRTLREVLGKITEDYNSSRSEMLR